MAESLREAHVVVQFTEVRRSTGEEGEAVRHWLGEAKLLEVPDEMIVSATALPEESALVVAGEEGGDVRQSLVALQHMLSKTLRPRPQEPKREAA